MRNQITYKKWTWDDDNVVYGRIETELSLPVSSLGIDTMEGEVVCNDPAILDFNQDDPVLVHHRGKQIGLYYLQDVTQTGADRYRFSAISPLGRLAQMEHRGGIYTNAPLAAVIGDICGNVPFIIKSNLTALKVSGFLPYAKPKGDDSNGISARDNLVQVLFAIGANLGTDRNGVLRIQNLWDGLASYIDADRVYRSGASLVREPPVSTVTVVEHQYIEGGDETTLFEGTATQGQVVAFPDPMYGLTAEGVSIVESGANYAVLSAGSGTLTGRPYLHLTREVSRALRTSGAVNQKRIEDATLVTLLNSAAVVDRMAEYYAHRTTIIEDITVDREHVGNVVSILDPFARTQTRATLAKNGLNLSATLKGSIQALVGFLPPQAEDQEYFDYRVVLTGSGVWTVPEGVSQITVVLIGGGSGAQPGNAGGAAPAPPQRTYRTTESFYDRFYRGFGFDSTGAYDDSIKAGEGGAPGQPGEGGKILRMDLTVTPGQSFSHTSGRGGLGVQFGTEEDHPGGDTSFGPYSSSTGTRSPLGFTDPITGEAYGASGADGVSGGRGACPTEATPPGVTVDGQTWVAGGHPAEAQNYDVGELSSQYGAFAAQIAASYGGGAAYGANGFDGTNTGVARFFRHSGETDYYLMRVYAAVRAGGANALPPPKATAIGSGGRGGNGGGGEGSIGLTYGSNVVPKGGRTGQVEAYSNSSASASAPRGPGKGSAGGEGADGGVLIYYRVLREKPRSGLFVEQRQKRFLVDKTGLYFIT